MVFFILFVFLFLFYPSACVTNLPRVYNGHTAYVWRRESASRRRKQCLLALSDFIILFLALLRSMLLRGAASALLRTTTEIFRSCPVSTVRFVRQSLRYPRKNRPFSTSVCLCKKKKTSLWLQLAEGQTMDGNIEEILAPLRLAVKEQVIGTYRLIFIVIDKECLFSV